MKNKYTILSAAGIFVICFSAIYYFGLPNKDKILPESKLYFLDQWMENLNTNLSVSKASKANKSLKYVEERIHEINNSSANSSITSQALLKSIKKSKETNAKLDSENSAKMSELLLKTTAEDVLSFANMISEQAPEKSLELKDTVKKTAGNVPASEVTDSILETIDIFEPEITTKGASLSISAAGSTGIPALTSVNLTFINNKINAINKQTAQLNAVNTISAKGIIAAINVQRNVVSGETIENNQVFFFKNSASGLVYIKRDYFESELDITTFLAANSTFMTQLGISYEELDWLCYNHSQALGTGESLVNFY